MKKLLLPTRRKLITGIAALSAARVITPSIARPIHGGSASPSQAPAQAQAWGYNRLAFYDDFTSLSTVDVNDTQGSGYNWYVHNEWPNSGSTNWQSLAPTPASCFSQSGSVLTCGATIPTGTGVFGNFLATACVDPTNSNNWRGRAWTPGFYIEAKFSYGTPSNGHAWPAFWTGSIAENATNPSIANFDEIDIFEHPTGSASNQSLLPAVHQWPSNSWNQYSANQTSPLPGSSFNTYGFLSVPTALNSGNGMMAGYVNNSLVTGSVQYYFPAGWPNPNLTGSNYNGQLMEWETQLSYLIFGWDDTGNIAIDWVKVWTA